MFPQQLRSPRHRWQTRIFLENSFRIQPCDCSLCIVAHLINVSNVIEGSTKAPGEVISLSSEKHQAGGIILEEFIRHQRWKDFYSAKDEEIRSDCALWPPLRSTSSLLGIKRNNRIIKTYKEGHFGKKLTEAWQRRSHFARKWMDG